MALDSERVQKIATLLGMATSPGSNQSEVLAHLELCSTSPDFNNNLAYIFASGDQLPVEVSGTAINDTARLHAWVILSHRSDKVLGCFSKTLSLGIMHGPPYQRILVDLSRQGTALKLVPTEPHITDTAPDLRAPSSLLCHTP